MSPGASHHLLQLPSFDHASQTTAHACLFCRWGLSQYVNGCNAADAAAAAAAAVAAAAVAAAATAAADLAAAAAVAARAQRAQARCAFRPCLSWHLLGAHTCSPRLPAQTCMIRYTPMVCLQIRTSTGLLQEFVS